MATPRQFKITLYPAKRDGAFITSTMELFGKNYPEKTISATRAQDVVAEATRFATEHGEGCRASVQVLGGARKPAGFDALCRGLYFNLDKPAAAPATA